MAQAPKPIRVMFRSELPCRLTFIVNPPFGNHKIRGGNPYSGPGRRWTPANRRPFQRGGRPVAGLAVAQGRLTLRQSVLFVVSVQVA